MQGVQDCKGFIQRLSKLKLVAKFIGLLTFSPNWKQSEMDSTDLTTATYNAITHLDSTQPVIPLMKFIEKAWMRMSLIGVIPWKVLIL